MHGWITHSRFRTLCLMGCALAAGLATPLVAAVEAQSPADAITLTSDKVTPEGCRLVEFTVHSEAMQREIQAIAVLPPALAGAKSDSFDPAAPAGADCPVLYALHGRGAPYKVYSDMIRLRRFLAAKPMIVVSFNADYASWYLDAPAKPESQFTTFFFDEFSPAVEDFFPANGKRAITGFSMGGFGALHLGLTRPDYFTSISGMSAAVDMLIRPDGGMEKETEELFGAGEARRAALEALRLFPRLEAAAKKAAETGKPLPPIYQHCGTEDFLRDNNRRLRDEMVAINKTISEACEKEIDPSMDQRARRRKLASLQAQRMLKFFYTESPGAHNWAFWHGNIEALLEFHARNF